MSKSLDMLLVSIFVFFRIRFHFIPSLSCWCSWIYDTLFQHSIPIPIAIPIPILQSPPTALIVLVLSETVLLLVLAFISTVDKACDKACDKAYDKVFSSP